MRPTVQVKAEEVDELSSSPKMEEKPQNMMMKEYGSNGALEAVNQMLASLLMRKEKGQDLLVWKPKKSTAAKAVLQTIFADRLRSTADQKDAKK